MSKTIHIRRYPNRRFYDRNSSKYVSLDDIEGMVQAGRTVEIRDSQSGEDLTRAVLTRIIVDRNPEKMDLFPTPMLHFILRSNEVMTGFLRDYFRHSLTYLEYLQSHGTAAPVHWVKAWLDGIRARPADGSTPAENNSEVSEDVVPDRAEELARQVEELEERIRQLESKQQEQTQ